MLLLEKLKPENQKIEKTGGKRENVEKSVFY
jgi:hypothetical protein